LQVPISAALGRQHRPRQQHVLPIGALFVADVTHVARSEGWLESRDFYHCPNTGHGFKPEIGLELPITRLDTDSAGEAE
jgi:hypothetical protein